MGDDDDYESLRPELDSVFTSCEAPQVNDAILLPPLPWEELEAQPARMDPGAVPEAAHEATLPEATPADLAPSATPFRCPVPTTAVHRVKQGRLGAGTRSSRENDAG
jgi:hypothetical protein